METNIVSTTIEKLQTVKVDGVYVNLEKSHLVLIDGKYQHVECIGDECPLCKYVDKINSFNYALKNINDLKIEKKLVKDSHQYVFVNTVDVNNQFKRIRYKIPYLSNMVEFDHLKQQLPKIRYGVRFNWITESQIMFELNNKEVSFTRIEDINLGDEITDFTPIPFNKFQYMKSQSEINFNKINEVVKMIDELNVSIKLKVLAICEFNQK